MHEITSRFKKHNPRVIPAQAGAQARLGCNTGVLESRKTSYLPLDELRWTNGSRLRGDDEKMSRIVTIQ